MSKPRILDFSTRGRSPCAFWAMALIFMISVLSSICACDSERYFGPFDLNVPTSLQERSDARTFELPLDSTNLRELDNLQWCQEHETDRELPCRCDYPVISLYEKSLRLDYSLSNASPYPVSATVWVGIEIPEQWPDVKQVPDLPRIALLASHTHRVKSGQRTDDIIDDSEMSKAQERYSKMFFEACESENSIGPAPMSFISGVSMDEKDEGEIQMEFTVRVRRGR